MSDSPMVSVPLDSAEQPILDKLLGIRTELELLKQDKSTYVKSQDILEFYNQIIEQVELLNNIRVEKRKEENRVDTVMEDCFQLVSLSFLTIGKNDEAPAVYCAVSFIRRLLDHLKEASFYCPKDLESIGARLKEYKECCERGKDDYSPHLMTLLNSRIEICKSKLRDLQQFLSHLSPELTPKYEKLVSILRSLSACNTKAKFPNAEVDDLVEQTKEVEKSLGITDSVDGIPDARSLEVRYKELVAVKTEASPEADKLVMELMTRCFLWARLIKEKQGKIDERFRETYDELLSIRNRLESLSLTKAWSLRETDLYIFHRKLDKIDNARVDGNFLDAQGKPSELHAQRTMLYLLRKSYALIYMLIISSEPVSEALLPIYNQLTTLRRCLKQVKVNGGVSSVRELYPYSMKLNSIDQMRKDGKFMVGNDIPDGQAAVSQLLAECFEIAYDLRNEADESPPKENSESEMPHDGRVEVK